MRLPISWAVPCLGGLGWALGCGSTTHPTGLAAGDETLAGDAATSEDALVDAAVPVDTGPVGYPAPHPPMPIVVNAGGPIMLTPKVVPITFDGDAFAPQIETFLDALGATPYWAATTTEYGVGAIAMSTPVHESTYPFTGTNVDDSQIQTWLTQTIGAGLPAYDGNTIYAVYLPAGKTVTLQGTTSCSQFGGYHDDTMVQDGHAAPYVVIPRCPTFGSLSGIDVITATSSHELIEASTDPHPETMPAYAQVDDNHIIWSLVIGGGEVADMCAQSPDVFYKPQGFDYTVQRAWSNMAAAAGHEPCAPALEEPYFNSAIVLPDTVTLDVGQNVQTEAVNIPVGQKKTIELDLYSDAATSGPWTLSAMDDAALQKQPPQLSFQFDKPSGKNGDKVHLTIEVLSAGQIGAEAFVVFNQLGSQASFWVGLVSNN